jgi:hypothetical protein
MHLLRPLHSNGRKVFDFLVVVLHQRLRGREVSASTMQLYRYDEQEKEISRGKR